MHRPQVGLVGHPVGVRAALPLDEAEDDALALPARRVGHELGLCGLDRAAHLPPGAHPLEAGVGQPAVLALVVGEGAGVDLLLGQAAGRADRARLRLGPVEQHVAAAVGDPLVDLAVDDVDEEHPALGAVVDAAPGLDPAVGVAHDEVLAHGQAALGDLDQDLVLAGAGPAAAGPLVAAQQLGQPLDRRGVVTVGRPGRPARRESRVLGQRVGGVALEPVVLGDHERPLFRTRSACASHLPGVRNAVRTAPRRATPDTQRQRWPPRSRCRTWLGHVRELRRSCGRGVRRRRAGSRARRGARRSRPRARRPATIASAARASASSRPLCGLVPAALGGVGATGLLATLEGLLGSVLLGVGEGALEDVDGVLALVDLAAHVGGEGRGLGRTTLGEGAVLLRLLGAVRAASRRACISSEWVIRVAAAPASTATTAATAVRPADEDARAPITSAAADGEERDGDGQARAALAAAGRRAGRL